VQVTQTVILAGNGVVHVIDAVLVPGEFPGSIADVVAASPRFSTLLTAVASANPAVLARLGGEADTTLFAPTNAAFAALPAGDLTGLLADEAELTRTLRFHALEGEVLSSAVTDGLVVTSLAGSSQNLTFTINNGVFVNTIPVTSFDITASNGVMHVISGVLLPPAR